MTDLNDLIVGMEDKMVFGVKDLIMELIKALTVTHTVLSSSLFK